MSSQEKAKVLIRVPKPATLRKYGLSEGEWLAILKSQGGVCPICKKAPESGLWATDHQHVPKWKKMLPEERRKYVRGILCFSCNHRCVGRFVTIFKAQNTVAYLSAYEERRSKTQ